MSKICTSLAELQKELQNRVNNALSSNVAKVVSDVMIDHIIQDVYDEYEPKRYIRRFDLSGNDISSPYDDTDNTGLLDPENIVTQIKGNTLIVEDNTLGSKYYQDGEEWKISRNAGKPIAGVIETGKGYDVWKNGSKPRPFIENTREELREREWHKKALKQGLQKQGLEVK